jgi:GNAT superfamily N-acetyltransferase
MPWARKWIRESPQKWDASKARIVGAAGSAVFGHAFEERREGELLPAEWWRVEEDGKTVGFGWMDVNWGDAEVLLAVDPSARGKGVGSFALGELEREASARGLNYLLNVVRPTHPARDAFVTWLLRRGFDGTDGGRFVKRVERR